MPSKLDRTIDLIRSAKAGAEFLWSFSEGSQDVHSILCPGMDANGDIHLSIGTGAEFMIRAPAPGQADDTLGWEKRGWGCAVYAVNEEGTLRRTLSLSEITGGSRAVAAVLKRIADAPAVYGRIKGAADYAETRRLHEAWFEEINGIANDISALAAPGLPQWLRIDTTGTLDVDGRASDATLGPKP